MIEFLKLSSAFEPCLKKLTWTPVGAGSPRPVPIYRPSLAVRSPDEKVKKHYRARGGALPVPQTGLPIVMVHLHKRVYGIVSFTSVTVKLVFDPATSIAS